MDNRQKERIIQLRHQMAAQHIDTFFVLKEENRFYLSGYTGEDSQIDESAGALVITQDTLMLLTDSRYVLQAKAEAKGYDVICYQKGLIKELALVLKQLNTKRLGFEGARVSYDQYTKLKQTLDCEPRSIVLFETQNMVEKQRLIKDDTEISAIKKAIEIAESEFLSFVHWLKPGTSEFEAAWELEKRIRSAGVRALSFPVISAFGKNSALPHAIPGNRELKESIPLLFDWGVRLNAYCSDMTRTIIMGKPDEQYNKIFTVVYDAQQKAIDAIKPGVSSKKIDDIARSHIASRGFKENFGHGLGHGVGLAVHEPPSISPLEEKNIIIEENMIFTIEPGIYIPEWGGVRLENMILVTADGVEILNQLNTEITLRH